MPNSKPANAARKYAILAAENFAAVPIHEALQKAPLTAQESALAREIAAGMVRRLLTIKYFARKLHKTLRLNRREKALLFSAIYQYVFMDSIPTYAIIDETMLIAKEWFGQKKARFFYAILQKLSDLDLSVPGKNTAYDLSLRLSYPPYFIKKMLEEYGVKKTISLLDIMNMPSALNLRIRKNLKEKPADPLRLKKKKRLYGQVFSASFDPCLTDRSDVYIQNVTPCYLFDALRKGYRKQPTSILDLCASPGGKLLLFHYAFPEAKLHANDVSRKKIERLQQNLAKYHVAAVTTEQRGEEFQSKEKYDLIIIDAPCSNSGVYHKRAEARWRFTREVLEELSDLQAALLENSVRYLQEGGEIWYMTCAILHEENEETLHFANTLGLTCRTQEKILPNEKGWDGGFAAAFVYNN